MLTPSLGLLQVIVMYLEVTLRHISAEEIDLRRVWGFEGQVKDRQMMEIEPPQPE